MYNSRLQIFGSEVYIFGETHIDLRETKVSYELCQRFSPNLICVESPSNRLYPSKSTGHSGIEAYTKQRDVPVVGIDTEPSDKSLGREGESIGEVFRSTKSDDLDDDIRTHRSDRMDDPITNIESREENMIYNIIESISRYNPDRVFVLVGKMHAHSITLTLSFISSM